MFADLAAHVQSDLLVVACGATGVGVAEGAEAAGLRACGVGVAVGSGDNDKRSAFERTIQADKLYALDRGYAKFSLFNRIHAVKSSYVCRVRDNSVYEVLEEKPLTDADRAANVLSDQIESLGQSSKKSDRPDHSIRLVIVKIKPHVSAGKYQGGSSGVNSDGFLRIATNLLDVPAEIIALLYHYRWTIEIFFRTFIRVRYRSSIARSTVTSTVGAS